MQVQSLEELKEKVNENADTLKKVTKSYEEVKIKEKGKKLMKNGEVIKEDDDEYN